MVSVVGLIAAGCDLRRRARASRNALTHKVKVVELPDNVDVASPGNPQAGAVVVVAIPARWLEVPLNGQGR